MTLLWLPSINFEPWPIVPASANAEPFVNADAHSSFTIHITIFVSCFSSARLVLLFFYQPIVIVGFIFHVPFFVVVILPLRCFFTWNHAVVLLR